jgi:transcriptional regulator with XRE-family HTH domain
MLTAGQIRAARALLNISQERLAGLAGISRGGLANVEGGENTTVSTLKAIRTVLESEGVRFGDADGSVKLLGKVETVRFNTSDRAAAKTALAIINAGRAARGQQPLVDEDE